MALSFRPKWISKNKYGEQYTICDIIDKNKLE